MKKIIILMLFVGASISAQSEDLLLSDELTLDDELILDELILEDIDSVIEPDIPQIKIEDVNTAESEPSLLELEDIEAIEPSPPAVPAITETNSTDIPPAPKTATQNKAPTAQKVKVNVVDVRETFYKLTYDQQTDSYVRKPTNEANPGDLIELVITATNSSNETIRDIQMVNNVPQGPITLLGDSFKTDKNSSLYLFSRNGVDFFPADADIDPKAIKHIQWLIFEMSPAQKFELSYRIMINN